MAGFKTHIAVSTTLGVAYGVGAFHWFDVSWQSATLAGTLCSVSGMLPDLDSDTGTPLRESLSFSSAAVAMMLMERFRTLDVSHETMVLAGVIGYLLIRFGFGAMLKQFTVHRGMFHSLPACLIASEVAFLIATGPLDIRLYKAGGVLLGSLSHLVLDEIWSVDLMRARVKSSSGTALKLWGKSTIANCCAYTLLALATLALFNDTVWVDSPEQTQQLHHLATAIVDTVTR